MQCCSCCSTRLTRNGRAGTRSRSIARPESSNIDIRSELRRCAANASTAFVVSAPLSARCMRKTSLSNPSESTEGSIALGGRRWRRVAAHHTPQRGRGRSARRRVQLNMHSELLLGGTSNPRRQRASAAGRAVALSRARRRRSTSPRQSHRAPQRIPSRQRRLLERAGSEALQSVSVSRRRRVNGAEWRIIWETERARVNRCNHEPTWARTFAVAQAIGSIFAAASVSRGLNDQ